MDITWVRSVAVALAALVGVICSANDTTAQCALEWLPGQGVPGVDGDVRALATLPNGDVVVGGSFGLADRLVIQNLARYSPTTGQWSPIGDLTNTGFSLAPVNSILPLPNGDIIVGTDGPSSAPTAPPGIVRFNGTTGVWSRLGSGVNGAVNALSFVPSSSGGVDLLVGGVFTSAGGVPASNIARFNLTTGVWSALGAGVNSAVRAMIALPSGAVIVGGEFTASGGVAGRSFIARLDPATGEWSALGGGVAGGASAGVFSLAQFPAGSAGGEPDVIAGGTFTTAGGVSTNNIARFSVESGTWSPLGSGVAGGSSPRVLALAVLPAGASGAQTGAAEIIAAGGFLSAGGLPQRSLARFVPATNTWSGIGDDTQFQFVKAIAVIPATGAASSEIVFGGPFTVLGGIVARGVARFTPSTNAWRAMGAPGTDGFISAMAVLPPSPGSGGPTADVKVVIGGGFNTVGSTGTAASRIAMFSPSSGIWSPLGGGVTGTVKAVAPLPDGTVIVGGQILNLAGGVPVSNIARYHPATSTWSALGGGVSGGFLPRVLALEVLPVGDVIVAGAFSSAGGGPASGIARYSPTTGIWSALGSGIDAGLFSEIRAVKYLPSPTGVGAGELIVGGSFTTAGGASASNIAKFNLATNTWSSLGPGTNNSVFALERMGNGEVLVAGFFSQAGNQAAGRIARVNPATGLWTGVGAGADGAIYTLAPLFNGDFIVAGSFGSVNGVAASNIARFNPRNNTLAPLSGGIGSLVEIALVLPGQDGDLLVGGSFDTAGGNVSANFARLDFTSSCPCGPSDVASANQTLGADGFLTADDIIVFLGWFFASDSRADIAGPNQSTTPDTNFTADDIIVFLGRYFAGC